MAPRVLNSLRLKILLALGHLCISAFIFGSMSAHARDSKASARDSSNWPSELLPLQTIIEPICEISPGIEEASAALKVQMRRDDFQSRYWIPTVRAFADYGLQDVDGNGVRQANVLDNSRGRLGLLAELNLNPLFGPHLKSRREHLRLESSRLLETLAFQEKLAEVIDLALNLVVLKSRDEDLEVTRVRLDRQYRTVQANVRAGVQKMRDQNRFEADLLRNSESRLALQRSIKETEARLVALTGSGVAHATASSLKWSSLLGLKIDPIDSIVTSPRLEQAQLEVEIRELDRELSQKETGLTFGLSSGLESTNSNLAPAWSLSAVREPFQSSWFVLLQLKYPLWDNGADSLRRFETNENERVSRLSAAQAKRDFESAKLLLQDEKTRLEERIRLANRLRELELRSFQLVAADYREGRAGYLDWIGASQSLQESVRAQIELASEWAKLWMKVKRLKGEMAGGLCEVRK